MHSFFVNPQNYFLSLEKTNPSSPSHDHVHGGLALYSRSGRSNLSTGDNFHALSILVGCNHLAIMVFYDKITFFCFPFKDMWRKNMEKIVEGMVGYVHMLSFCTTSALVGKLHVHVSCFIFLLKIMLYTFT